MWRCLQWETLGVFNPVQEGFKHAPGSVAAWMGQSIITWPGMYFVDHVHTLEFGILNPSIVQYRRRCLKFWHSLTWSGILGARPQVGGRPLKASHPCTVRVRSTAAC